MRYTDEELGNLLDEVDDYQPKKKKAKSKSKPQKTSKNRKTANTYNSKGESFFVFIKTKQFLGICLVIVAAIVAFGIVPVINIASDTKIDVVVAKIPITKGTVIDKEMLSIKSVGGYGIKDNAVKSTDVAIGKYATVDIIEGDMILSSKLSAENPLRSNSYLADLEIGKQAIAIALPSLDVSVAGSVVAGDIVSCIVNATGTDEDREYAGIQPPELRYLKVLDVKDKFGNSVADIFTEETQPTMAILEVNEYQATALAGISSAGTVHLTVCCRNNETLAEELLELQADFFKTDEEREAEKALAEQENSSSSEIIEEENITEEDASSSQTESDTESTSSSEEVVADD